MDSVYDKLESFTYAFSWLIKYDREQTRPFENNNYKVPFDSIRDCPIGRVVVKTQYDNSGTLALHCSISSNRYKNLEKARCFTTFRFINLHNQSVGKLISPSEIISGKLMYEQGGEQIIIISSFNCKVTVPEWLHKSIDSILRPDDTIQVLTEVRIISDQNLVHLFKLTDDVLYYQNDSNEMENSEALLNIKELCDVTLISTDGSEFQAHKAILAARSPVFLSTFVHNMKEKCENKVEMKDVHSSVLEPALKFIYTGKFEGSSDMASELLYFADKYDIKKLKMKCEDELVKILNVKNCVPILILADRHTSENLKSKAVVFMKNNISAVVKTDEYKDLISHPHLLNDILLTIGQSVDSSPKYVFNNRFEY